MIVGKTFDSNCGQFSSESMEYNLVWLKAQQNYFNDLLATRGHVFLNEIYDSLGFKRIPGGQVNGWAKGAGCTGEIDFGVRVNGDVVELTFNPDGYILDLI